ncbi:hypothetical protein G7046_g6092 [Stylonectria norvegica]|nr:hypothetical protein G7046_g6092 [Stylonectria norvegica]
MGLPATEKRGKVAIVGAGVVGLTTALLLSDAGYHVTIVARNLPGDQSTEWASPWAGALLAPHPDSGFTELQEASLKIYQDLAENEPLAGVKKVQITEYYDDRPENATVWYENMPTFRYLPRSELPAGVAMGYVFNGLVVNPTQFLLWISQKLKSSGVSFIQKTLASLDELKQLTSADVLVNASGAGAETLAGDTGVHRIRGQTMFVKAPAHLLNQAVMRQGSQYTYVIPRPGDGGVILGGVRQEGDVRTAPDVSLRADILRRVNEMTDGAFAWVDLERDVLRDIVGFRPGRKGGLRVEREGEVVHAYGVEGLGYLYSFGVAGRVRELVMRKLKAKL